MAECLACEGIGVIGYFGNHCLTCNGTGNVPEPTISVTISEIQARDPERWLREMDRVVRSNADPNRRNAVPTPWCQTCGQYHPDDKRHTRCESFHWQYRCTEVEDHAGMCSAIGDDGTIYRWERSDYTVDQDKRNAREKAKSKLIHEWDHGPPKSRERYRLIAVADHTPGYEDRYYIERLGADGLGEPRWDGVAEIKNAPTSNDTFQLMLSAIKSLIKDAP